MNALNCEVKIADIQGLESQKLTVGRPFTLECQEPSDALVTDIKQAKFESAQLPPLMYKVFNMTKNEKVININMTFYAAGTFDMNTWQLKEGDEVWSVTAPAVKFETVLQPPQNGEPQKPFGPVFPLELNIPSVYFLYLLGVIVLIALLSFLKIRRVRYYRKLKEGLKKYQSPIDPDVQFYRKVRALEKKDFPLSELEEAYRLYVLRTFSIPCFELDDKRLIRYFKRNLPQFKESRILLQKYLNEFSELKKNENSLSLAEKNDLLKKLYRYVDQHRTMQNPGDVS